MTSNPDADAGDAGRECLICGGGGAVLFPPDG